MRRYVNEKGVVKEDHWNKQDSVAEVPQWTGKTEFFKLPQGEVLPHTDINDIFMKLL